MRQEPVTYMYLESIALPNAPIDMINRTMFLLDTLYPQSLFEFNPNRMKIIARIRIDELDRSEALNKEENHYFATLFQNEHSLRSMQIAVGMLT